VWTLHAQVWAVQHPGCLWAEPLEPDRFCQVIAGSSGLEQPDRWEPAVFRSSATPRLVVGLTLAATVGAGVGLVMVGHSSPSGATPPASSLLNAAASTAAAPSTSAPPRPAPAPLTIGQAEAVALRLSPGTVVEVTRDDPTADAPDPAEATDPADAPDASDPTGPAYEITVRHGDGSETEVVVDATTGRVVSTTPKDGENGN